MTPEQPERAASPHARALASPLHPPPPRPQGDNKDFEEKLAEQLFAGEDNTDKKNVRGAGGRG
jgi:hypothetical protein